MSTLKTHVRLSSDLKSFFLLHSELGTAMAATLSPPPEEDQDRPSDIMALMATRSSLTHNKLELLAVQFTSTLRYLADMEESILS